MKVYMSPSTEKSIVPGLIINELAIFLKHRSLCPKTVNQAE